VSPSGDCAAFAFGGKTISVGEVVRAAQFRGELRPSVIEVAWKLASEAEAERWNLEADGDAVEAMIGRFRYEKDLISAEEAEAWLEVRGLSMDDFQDYFTRCYWRETLKEKVVPSQVDPSRVMPDRLGTLQIDLLISGAIGPLAVALGRRLVARAAADSPAEKGRLDAERGRFLERAGLAPGGVAAWLQSLGRDEGWLDGMIEMEALYRQRCDAVLTPERLAQALAAARLPLTTLEVERVEFDSADAAREALLCVRDDGLSLKEVARESRYPFERVELLAEDLPEDQRQRLLCAAIGEIQEPAPAGGVIHLSRVLRKTEPALADASVRRRIEQRILDTYFAEAGSKDIRWLIT
jgi:hypothetical protein